MKDHAYVIPDPILDEKEIRSLEELTNRYNKLSEPGKIAKSGKKVKQAIIDILPDEIIVKASSAKQSITEAKVYEKAMKIVADGFEIIEKNASKYTISEKKVINKINGKVDYNTISSIEEICLARGYVISKEVNKYKAKSLGVAFIEGGGTGVFGFSGIPFNLVLSTFIFFRAVQSIAMYYGFDIKNDDSELIIASDVLSNAMSPTTSGNSEVGSAISIFMVMAELTTIKTTVKKGWTAMASRGGLTLAITQIRALANKAAAKAIDKAGKAAIEKQLFKNLFEQLGKRLTQKVVERSVPVIGGGIGALFDTSIMNSVFEYADVFYNKRFLVEKEERIHLLTEESPSQHLSDDVLDVDFVEVEDTNEANDENN